MRYLVLYAVLVLTCAAASGTVNNIGEPSSMVDIQVEVNDGALALKTRDAPLHEVMRAIGELAGFKTVLVGEFATPPLVSVSFESISVREAVERLVSHKNRIIQYAPAANRSEQRISQVWLLESVGEPVDLGAAGGDQGIALGRKKDVEGYKLARLTTLLQQDQSVVARTRAAIALGAFDDQRAVFALESALSDRDPSVRAQAISALGRNGTEQASMVLGSILLHEGANRSERILAARALWKHDSSVARDYLRAGANDPDAQVRSASSKRLSSSKSHSKNNKAGEVDTQ